MKILLYNPDNGVTRNFMPHLWMFLLQALTPSGHEVLLIDGNAQPMDEAGIARYVREQNIDLVGIGAMTRMIAKAYRMAANGPIGVAQIDLPESPHHFRPGARRLRHLAETRRGSSQSICWRLTQAHIAAVTQFAFAGLLSQQNQ